MPKIDLLLRGARSLSVQSKFGELLVWGLVKRLELMGQRGRGEGGGMWVREGEESKMNLKI